MYVHERGVIVGLLGIALVVSIPTIASAQAHATTQPDSVRHIQTVVPRSGPPGTRVVVETLNLPFEARVHIGIGTTDGGFESLAEVLQDELGAVSVNVAVPDHATWDRATVFVAFNGIFAPIGRSYPFHVTDSRGWIQRTGSVTNRASGCTVFTDTAGFEYALVGSQIDRIEVDTEVVIEGQFAETSTCGDVIDSIEVDAVRATF